MKQTDFAIKAQDGKLIRLSTDVLLQIVSTKNNEEAVDKLTDYIISVAKEAGLSVTREEIFAKMYEFYSSYQQEMGAIEETPMLKVNIKAFNNPKGYTQYNEVVEALGHCGSVIKHVCGIAYAMSYYTMLDTIDYIKKDGLYKQTIKQKVNEVIKERENYISRLKNPAPGEAEFFNLKRLQPDARRRYRADLTTEEYFQTWLDMGASSYKGYKPMIDALQHKYFKSLSEHGVKHAKTIAWCITTEVTLEIAVEAYNSLLKELRDGRGLPIEIINMEFAPFCLINVQEKWAEALKQIYPDIVEYEKSVHDDRNITMGINDLKDAFAKELSTTNAIRESVEDNADIFATKGFFKKEMTKIAETEQELINKKSA